LPVYGREPLSEPEIEALKLHKQKLAEADLPIERKEVPLQEAIEYYRSEEVRRQVSLLKHRKKTYLTMYLSTTTWTTITVTCSLHGI